MAWIHPKNHAPGLLIDKKIVDQKFRKYQNFVFKLLKKNTLVGFSNHYFLSTNSQFLQKHYSLFTKLFKRLKIENVSGSDRFRASLEKSDVNRNLVKIMQSFSRSKDAKLLLANQELQAKLFPHQRVAVDWLLKYPSGLLGDDMGLGKTLSVLAAAEELQNRSDIDFLLVICPNSLVKNWIREQTNWLVSYTLAELSKSKSSRIKLLQKLKRGFLGVRGLVLNYEALRL